MKQLNKKCRIKLFEQKRSNEPTKCYNFEDSVCLHFDKQLNLQDLELKIIDFYYDNSINSQVH